MVDKSLKLYNGSDLLPVNDYTDEDWTDWSQTELAMAADGGDSTASTWQLRDEGGVIPDRSGLSGSYYLEAHNVVKLTVGSNTLFNGRLGYDDRTQGRQPSAGVDTHSNKGRAVEFSVTLGDANEHLRGIIVHNWVRPEETDAARVQALVAAYLSGSPRPSTNLNGSNFVITGSNTFTVPAKTYYGVTPGEVLQELAELSDKQMFVDVDDNLHFHGNDYGWNAPIRISDDPTDLDAVTCVPIDASRADEARDTLTALRVYWGNTTSGEQNTFLRTDTTKMEVNDYWEDVYFDSESTTWAEASNRASNQFVPRKLDQTSYTVTIGKPGSKNGEPWTSAEIALAPKAGQLIDFKALKARGGRASNGNWLGDTFLNRRIKEVRWTFPTADGFYCQLILDRPRHSLLGGTPFHKPSPPDTGTPGTPGTGCTTSFTRTWSYTASNSVDSDSADYPWSESHTFWSPADGYFGSAYSWTGLYNADLGLGSGTSSPIACNPGDNITFSGRIAARHIGLIQRTITAYFYGVGTIFPASIISTQPQLTPASSNSTTASFSLTWTVPAGATAVGFRIERQSRWDDLVLTVQDCSMATPATDPIPGTSPVTTVGGTDQGVYSDSQEYVPVGSVLEHQYITEGGPYHDADQIAIDDTGGYFTGTDVEAALQEIGSGLNLTIDTIDPSGASQELDVSDHSVFEIHLDADCSVTFTGMVADRTNRWWVHVIGDGTHVPIFPDVLWPDSTAPTFDPTADSHWLEFVSTDALGIYGDYGGAAATAFALTVKEEGVALATDATSLDFVGSGVVASGTGAAKTITISGAPTGAAGGDLSGTYPNPSVVDDSHSHTSATLPATSSSGSTHEHIVDEQFSGDASATVFNLANEAQPESAIAYVAGTRTSVTVGGAMNDQITFGSAPASGTLNISVDYVAVAS